MSNFCSLTKCVPQNTDCFFFDANVWLFIYAPMGNYAEDQRTRYSSLLNDILNANAKIFITSLLISEIYNRILRSEYKLFLEEEKKTEKEFPYKKFRKQFADQEYIIDILQQILEIAVRLDDGFGQIDSDQLLSGLETFDFNDKYFMALAKSNNLIIITHDSDFKQCTDIPIFSALS